MNDDRSSAEQYFDKFQKEILDSVSPTFCLAKWHRTTIRTDQGLSYSCHHCVPEEVDRQSVIEDSRNMVSPPQVQEQRRQMLNGERPKECEYCWQAEDSGQISDRITKSASIYINNIDTNPTLIEDAVADVTGIPKTLEVCMDNTCNFKCTYCSATYSSKWYEELKQLGPYPTTTKRKTADDCLSIPQREVNPYTEAFWDIWNNHRDKLFELKITGGEPMLSKNLYRIMDNIIADGHPELLLSINSNFCPPDAIFDKFMDKAKQLDGKVKRFKVYTSAESVDGRAEYGRFGMDFELFKKNVLRFLQETKFDLDFMMAINALSITDFMGFIKFFTDIARKYPHRISLTANIVRYPAYLDVRILPEELLKELHTQFSDEIDEHLVWFEQKSRLQIKRLIGYLKDRSDFVQRKRTEPEVEILRKDFVLFVDEHDRRRGTDFASTYPELVPFYNSVKAGMDSPDK